MTPELISRVDTVLAARLRSWPLPANDDERRMKDLAFKWYCDSKRWRSFASGAGKIFLASETAGLRGVLLALVREAWNDPHANTDATLVQGVWRWWVHVPSRRPGNVDDTIAGRGDTEDDALVSALEAAPEVPG
jgi:hypothetical protein